jgi:hypothetical protein
MATAMTDEPATPDGPAAGDTSPAPATRVNVGELLSAVSALLLLAAMFATEWYGVAGVPDPSYARPATSTAENGFNGLTDIRWVMLLTIVAAIGSVFLHASQREHGNKTDTRRIVTALGALTALLLIYRVLIDLPGNGTVLDQKLGAFLGLLCALGIAWGGYESVIQQRARRAVAAPRSRRRERITAGRSGR